MTFPFNKPKPSLSEMEEQGEMVEAEISLKEKRLILKRLNEQLGEGGANSFRENGSINWNAAKAWLKNH